MVTAAAMPISREASTHDEVSMQQSLLFSDSLKDLKNLRTQLYSAAEYFELCHTNDDQKQIVVETLKDYVIKALVNTVDHLGSVAYKVNDILDEKVEEVSGTKLRVSCLEQWGRACMVQTIESQNTSGCSPDDEDDWHQFRTAVRATIRETPTSSIRETPMSSARKGRSPSPSTWPLQRSATFSFTATMPKKELEKQTVSPHRFPLLRSGSVRRPTTPNKSLPTTPSTAGARQRYPSEPRRSASMHLQSEKDNLRDVEQYPSKTKRLLKALLSHRKSKKDEMLYTYLDEY